MKRVIKAVAIVMVLLLLFSCNKEKDVIIEPKISTNLTIQNDNITLQGTFSRTIEGKMEYVISSPPEVLGMKYVYSENLFTVYYHNMERSGELFINSPVRIIFNAINEAVLKPLDNNIIMTENGKCNYYIKNKRINKIEITNIIATFEYR